MPSYRKAYDRKLDAVYRWQTFTLFSIAIAFLAIIGSYILPVLTRSSELSCKVDSDCPSISDNTCLSFYCEDDTCTRELKPGFNCSSDEECGNGFVCSDCVCSDPCEGVVCQTEGCRESICVRPEGVCVLSNVTSNCCETKEDCLDLSTGTCYEIYCNTENSTCGVRFANNGTCASSTDCQLGETCLMDSCTCVDLCESVMCSTSPCYQEICDRFSGECIPTAIIPNCCTNSGECTTTDVCSDPVCIDNVCGTQLKNSSSCSTDDDCPGSFCVDCNCTAIPDPECMTNEDCMQPSDLCIGRICVSEMCYFFSTPSCCSLDTDCEDSDPCTDNECDSQMCVFTQRDEDGDDIVCNVDCDDTNSSIGPSLRWCRDADGDGFGNNQIVQFSCFQPMGFVISCDDCDDNNPNIYPGSENCDYTLSQTLFDTFDSNVLPYFRQCGFDTDVFLNLSAVVCPEGVFSGTLQGGKMQMWIDDNGIWIPTDSYIQSFPGTNPILNAVKISGSLVVLGVTNDLDPDTGVRSGTVKIFRYDFLTNTLSLLQTLGVGLISGATAGASFGYSVSIHGTTIVAGAPFYDGPSGTDTGAVFIFDEISPDTWSLTLQINEPFSYQIQAYFGWAVSIDSQYLIIGAPSTSSRSLSYVAFYENILGSWTFQWQYPSGGEALRTRTGYSVSVNQEAPVATSLSSVSGASTEGTLFIFDHSGTLIQTFIRPAQSSRGTRDLYGYDVEIAGSKIVVGAPDADGLVTRSGIVALYFKTTTSAIEWSFATRIWPFDIDTLSNAFYGNAVSICLNEVVTVGSPGWETRSTGIRQGAVYNSECNREYTCNPI